MKRYLGILFLVTGCGSVINGSHQSIPVTTNPPGATITETQTQDSALSPSVLDLKRDKDYVLTITKEGYETQTVKIQHVISGTAAGNLVGLTILGTAIDNATGAAWDLKPENIVVTLTPLSPEEKANQAHLLTKETLQSQLVNLEQLKSSNLLTDSQYAVLRNLTIQTANAG